MSSDLVSLIHALAVVVSSEYRRQGKGRRLMTAAEQYAASLQCHTVHLSTHDKESFYRRLGYLDGPSTSPLRCCVAKLSQEQVSLLIFSA